MALIPPKRLFHVPSMSTVMYEDVVDNVREKGYAAVSHVWGDQQMYSADELGILSGVDWKVPLANPDKMTRLKDVMLQCKKEYCWFDVLCMPQDKQDEINLEIPFMGEYYSGADVTFVLSDICYNILDDFTKWYEMVGDAMRSERDFTGSEEFWILYLTSGRDLANFYEDQWFTRVWTLQEAVLSKQLILISTNKICFNLLDIVNKLLHTSVQNFGHTFSLFPKSREILLGLANAIEEYKSKTLDLARILNMNNVRNCYKIHDKFYGVLGILGYKNIVVDYKTNMDDLSRTIIQHSYSKGDISWMAIGGCAGKGFIQPVYRTFPYLGLHWTEDRPDICEISFQDDVLCMKAITLATITHCESFAESGLDNLDFEKWTARIFRNWGFNAVVTFAAMIEYIVAPEIFFRVGIRYLNHITNNKTKIYAYCEMMEFFGEENMQKYFTEIFIKMSFATRRCKIATVVRANIPMQNDDYPLIISGNANIGDKIIVPRGIHDRTKRNLGIIVSSSGERKGVCFIPQIKIEEEISDQFVQHKFPL